jgi:hypothetical protein
VRQQLEQSHMPVEEVPEDEGTTRMTYNFAPGNHGLVYRADGPDHGGKQEHETNHEQDLETEQAEKLAGQADNTKYKLQAMKWGWYCLVGRVDSADVSCYPRSHPFLDQAQPRLRFHAEDNKLS